MNAESTLSQDFSFPQKYTKYLLVFTSMDLSTSSESWNVLTTRGRRKSDITTVNTGILGTLGISYSSCSNIKSKLTVLSNGEIGFCILCPDAYSVLLLSLSLVLLLS